MIQGVVDMASTTASGGEDKGILPWASIPRFTPGVTDVTEYTKKLHFLAEVWPKESLPALAPRVALLTEGTSR